MQPDIYTMELHEETSIGNGTSVLRVAGGWVYIVADSHESNSTVFVPYDNQFQTSGDEQ